MRSMLRSRSSATRSAGARGAGLLRVLLAVAIAGAPLLAFEDPNGGSGGATRNSPPSNSGGGQVAGDETIGTLPIVGPGETFDLFRFLLDRQACLSLEGARVDVFSAIVGVEGRTAATLESIDPTMDVVRITFHGSPRLLLDRGLVDSGAVRVGVSVPTAFGAGSIEARLGGRVLGSEAISAGSIDVPFLGTGASSVLTARPLTLRFDGANGAHTSLRFQTTSDLVLVGQTH